MSSWISMASFGRGPWPKPMMGGASITRLPMPVSSFNHDCVESEWERELQGRRVL